MIEEDLCRRLRLEFQEAEGCGLIWLPIGCCRELWLPRNGHAVRHRIIYDHDHDDGVRMVKKKKKMMMMMMVVMMMMMMTTMMTMIR